MNGFNEINGHKFCILSLLVNNLKKWWWINDFDIFIYIFFKCNCPVLPYVGIGCMHIKNDITNLKFWYVKKMQKILWNLSLLKTGEFLTPLNVKWILKIAKNSKRSCLMVNCDLFTWSCWKATWALSLPLKNVIASSPSLIIIYIYISMNKIYIFTIEAEDWWGDFISFLTRQWKINVDNFVS